MRLLGAPFTDEERLAAIAAARALLGVRWGHHGRGRRLDCLGMVHAAACAVRPAIPALPTDYGRTPYGGTLRSRMCQWLGDPVQREPRPGDVVSWTLAGEENHVGLITDHRDYGIGLIHCYARTAGGSGGKVIEHGIDAKERRRIVEVWAL
ncbi:hypothetical protein [Luteimonas saliphila]|uniref:hypothetical protein n=1 Tax=Luteimonas saliphila TaxID=2804919 RepID=UPI00192DC14C|nr:hypothetical protein [Luteimonas saliphila]